MVCGKKVGKKGFSTRSADKTLILLKYYFHRTIWQSIILDFNMVLRFCMMYTALQVRTWLFTPHAPFKSY